MNEEAQAYITPEIEKRRHRRAILVTQVRCETLGRQALLLTRDVSVGGMFVTTKESFPLQSELSVSFQLSSAAPPISCRGKVVYSVPGVGLGVEFDDLSEEARQALEKFVAESS